MHAICLLLVELLPCCTAHVSCCISGIHGIGVVVTVQNLVVNTQAWFILGWNF